MTQATRRQIFGGVALGGLATLAPALARAQTAPFSWPPFGSPTGPIPRLTGHHRVIIDTDPGNDDALAILMCLDAPNLKVEAITVCPGNVRYDQEVKNALYLVELAGKAGKVPVHAGMRHPILDKPYPTATFIHGKDGLGRVSVPEVAQKVDPEHAVDAMRRIIKRYPGEVVIFALGGLTNLAMALLREPEIAKDLKGVLFVGGKYAGPGSAPGYNVLVDPEAAHVVLTSGVPITLSGGLAPFSVMHDADFDQVATFGTARSRFFMESNDLRRTFEKQNRGTTGSTNPDPIAVALVINPDLGTRWMQLYMQVELSGDLTRGQLIYGANIYSGAPTPPPNVNICLEASNTVFKTMVFDTLKKA
ncbi:hypothetical protein BH10PSE4_BH10PSE4_35840 [soil metagenome]